MHAPFDIAADLDTPVSAYRKLAAFEPCFLLESVEGGTRLGRYSFIGLGIAQRTRIGPHSVTADEHTLPRPADTDALAAFLRARIDAAPALHPRVPGLPFDGGLVGATGYDVVRTFERLPAVAVPRPHEPEALYVAPRSLLVFDHLTRRVALLHAGEEWERLSLRREIVHALRGAMPPAPVRSGHAPPTPSMTEAEFLDRVARAKHHIVEGDIFQIVLGIRYEGGCRTDPFEVYRALRLLNPSSYMYFLDFGDVRVVGSSPEALVRLNGREASLRPIAGTRPRGLTDAEDLAHERELLADPKEAAEHVMLVDLARNDLGRVAEAGSIRVDPYRIIERYSHVMHIVSGVRGRVRPGVDAVRVLAAAFPAGTLVGAPKVRAMELIESLEPVRRGFYGGTVGYFAKGGDTDQAICIRTLVFADGRYAYQGGAGIVADSVAEMEHREIRAKVGILEAALDLAERGL